MCIGCLLKYVSEKEKKKEKREERRGEEKAKKKKKKRRARIFSFTSVVVSLSR